MRGLEVSPIYGIWNVASSIYDVPPPEQPMLSKDEFFNDLCINHSSSDGLEAPHHLHHLHYLI